MSLSAADHFLLANAQREQQQFQRDLALEQSGLYEQLANKTAAHEAYDAVLKAILDAYNSGDHERLNALLSNRDARSAIYRPVYDYHYARLMSR